MRKEPNPPAPGLKPPPPSGPPTPRSADVDQLHRMLKCSVFGWPEGELEKAHALLDRIAVSRGFTSE
jgi:hypothetical protein